MQCDFCVDDCCDDELMNWWDVCRWMRKTECGGDDLMTIRNGKWMCNGVVTTSTFGDSEVVQMKDFVCSESKRTATDKHFVVTASHAHFRTWDFFHTERRNTKLPAAFFNFITRFWNDPGTSRHFLSRNEPKPTIAQNSQTIHCNQELCLLFLFPEVALSVWWFSYLETRTVTWKLLPFRGKLPEWREKWDNLTR